MIYEYVCMHRRMLVDLFQRCGRLELKFLVDSGFGFGVCLGVIQMALWVFYELPWTLAAGGAVVGYLTNWMALKLIFEPIDPVRACMHACIFFLPCTLYTYACIFEPIDPVRL